MIPRRRRRISAGKKSKASKRQEKGLQSGERNADREGSARKKKKKLVSIVPLYLGIVTIKTIIMLHTQMIRYEYKE